jgi:hypothetical protein
MSTCLDNVLNILNPKDLLLYGAIPAAVGAAASRFVGGYKPDPAAEPRRFKPLTTAVYCGVSSLMSKLIADGLCRVYHHVPLKSVVQTVQTLGDTIAPYVLLSGGIATLVGIVALPHITARDAAQLATGEVVDYTDNWNYSVLSRLIFF